MLKVGDRCSHRNDVQGRVFIVTAAPDERGWLAYRIDGEDDTEYSGNERDMALLSARGGGRG